MEIGMVERIDIDREMQQAYLDYAMSVIVARALPDARDGLKPVHRRILYAMHDMALRPDSPHKKSARIVGEVLGKYHPHGDMAVYDAMARMAQDFSMRYLLVEGQGNFGSVDGDPPAAMRYTEARLTNPAMQMLADIDRDTVNFTENFDGALSEPEVLPSSIPNLLINGAIGIAVGMATSIPPHNLGEVVEALQFMLQRWEKLDDISIDELTQFVKGPDFPTGGVILHSVEGDGLAAAYGTGRGRITVQASAHLEEMERGRNRIIVTELPYMTNKSSLIERIADLAREERIEGIVDLRDESDRQGMRIVIELSKTANPDAVLRDLYRLTPMQSTFSIIMLALVNGEPRLLSLKQALRVYLEHRLEVVRRRSEYELDKAKKRIHILEGLRIALQNLDEVIEIIRKSPDVETARSRLIRRFKISEIQAQAILDMPLRRLAALERKKIEEEYRDLAALIKQLEALLRSPKKMRQLINDELQSIKDAFGDRRRTHIVHLREGDTKASLLTKTDLLEEKNIWISVDSDGLISRSHTDKLPKQSGKESPKWLIKTTTRDTLFLVDEAGEAAAIPVHAVPETDEISAGVAFHRISPFTEKARLAAIFALPTRSARETAASAFDTHFLLCGTRKGMLKKTALSELPGASASLFTLVKVNEGDQLGWVKITNGNSEVLLVSARGMAIRFKEDSIRPMGLVAAGVMGMKLAENDLIAGMEALPRAGEVLLVSRNGHAKRLTEKQFPIQGRYGQGVLAWKLPTDDEIIGTAIGKGALRVTLHIHKLLPKAIRLDEAPIQTRAARGAKVLDLKTGQAVMYLSAPWDPERISNQLRSKPAARQSSPNAAGRSAGGSARTSKASTKPASKKTAPGSRKKTQPSTPKPPIPKKPTKGPRTSTRKSETTPGPTSAPAPKKPRANRSTGGGGSSTR
ncbi:MAG: hypothetical protein B6D39_09785 [Anaerolineae bacterium UTCFX2]|jgi:DNA gyrase subunit A|nr:DNA gyrase subunit A [Anaerolineales bacterium]OQY89249.1 MAG: hypothetical protein B6D39_09785 [Anaerolineae bacterium UTCFX2]